MDIKQLLGDKYREDMTHEELLEALAEIKLETQTTEPDLTGYIEKSKFDEVSSQLAKAKKDLSATTAKTQTTEEQLETLREQIAEAERLRATDNSRNKAVAAFLKAGLSEEAYEPLLEAIVSEDEGATLGRVTQIVDVLAKQKNEAVDVAKAELIKNNPKPDSTSTGSGEMTQEAFLALSFEERTKLYQTDPVRYEQLAAETTKNL